MMRKHVVLSALIAFLSLVVSGCSSSPTSPSSTSASVTLHGTAVGPSAASTSSAGGLQAMSVPSAGRVTVTVLEKPSITTTISGNGTFELEGLPAGNFTLVFSSNGVTLGTITITSVPNQAEIEVVVQITTTTVVLVKVEINGTDAADATKTCLINGGRVSEGIELEGSVNTVTGTSFEMAVNGQRASGPVTVDTSGASFSCAGVKGTCDATLLKTDAKVHVRGTLISCSMQAAQVKATEVKFQH